MVLRFTIAAMTLLFSVCKFDLGQQPVGAPVNSTSGNNSVFFSLIASRNQILANYTDTTLMTATLADTNRNFIAGDTVYFKTTHGFIAASAVTNSNGIAQTVLFSDSYNGSAIVTAISPKYQDTVRTIVMFSGISLSLQANVPSAKVNENITVSAKVTDLTSHPLGNDTILFTVTSGVFSDNVTTVKALTSTAGAASVIVTARSKGTVVVKAAINGTIDSITLTFSDTVAAFSGARNFSLYSSKSQLKADNSDTATITAELKDTSNNPSTGDTVKFISSIGTIGGWAIVDSSGRARVTLRSQRVNGTCKITAIAPKSKDTVTTLVTFSGIKVQLESNVVDLKINDSATVTAVLTDASGNPFGGDSVIFTAKGGVFQNGLASTEVQFDPNGHATVKFTSSAAAIDTIRASALKSSDSMTIVFTNNALNLVASKQSLIVGGVDASTLTATFVNGSNQPVAGIPVTFSTNAGTITTATVNTNAAGQAQTTLASAFFAGTATVVATTAAGNAVIKINFLAAAPKALKLTLSPDNIGVNGGVATLTATVTDTNGNMVTGANVNFKLLKGPGGGEYIDKPTVTTQNGVAHAQLFAGAIPSQFRSCLVSAAVGAIADSTKLTISGSPYAISIAVPQSDTVVVTNTGAQNSATFDYNAGAVVVDINGNPVADGTQVNFSVVVSGMAVHRLVFDHWTGLGSTDQKTAVMRYVIMDVPFEDIDNNFKMDENDLELDNNDAVAARGDDVNGDGVCDFNPSSHDLWYDFNWNGKVDVGSTLNPIVMNVPVTKEIKDTVCKDTIIQTNASASPDTSWKDTVVVICHQAIGLDTVGYKKDTVGYDTSYTGAEPNMIVDGTRIWADLYPNGVWDTTELVRDVGPQKGVYFAPASGDRRYWEYECLPYWFGQRFDFDKNNYAIAITTSATCVNGVANVHVTYPRQLARRLFVSIFAESNGVRNNGRNGERFILPVILGQ
jgi:hypothetical protein